jgi:hypothetical protein
VPATFPSHAAAVLPLKVWWPRRFDGVALVVGSAVPDAGYAVVGVIGLWETHTWAGLLWWCLPVGLVACRFIRALAPATARHLPDAGHFALRDYGVLGVVRHPWWMTVGSLLTGAVTHLVWDSFTHPPGAGRVDLGVALIPALTAPGPFGLPWWKLLQQGSTAGGAVVAVATLWWIGRRRLLREWHGAPPAGPRRPAAFWSAASAVAVTGAVVSLTLPAAGHSFVLGVRLLYVAALAALAGSVAAAVRR